MSRYSNQRGQSTDRGNPTAPIIQPEREGSAAQQCWTWIRKDDKKKKTKEESWDHRSDWCTGMVRDAWKEALHGRKHWVTIEDDGERKNFKDKDGTQEDRKHERTAFSQN